MFALLAYEGNNAAPAANFDLTAATDPDFTARNGHYTFTEPYKLLMSHVAGLTLTDARFSVPTWNAIGEARMFNLNVTAELPGNPPLLDNWEQLPMQIPTNEEFQVQCTNTVAHRTAAGIWIATPGHSRQLPSGFPIQVEATTASFTPAAFVWSGPQALVLNQSLRGGCYAVIGAALQFAADVLYFRLIFPRSPMQFRRKLRPGRIAQNAIGDQEPVTQQANRFHMGVWGAFHTFELPQVEVFAVVSAAMTPVLRLWLVYLGESESLLNPYLASLT